MSFFYLLACTLTLGLSDGRIRDEQISASSELDDIHAAKQGRVSLISPSNNRYRVEDREAKFNCDECRTKKKCTTRKIADFRNITKCGQGFDNTHCSPKLSLVYLQLYQNCGICSRVVVLFVIIIMVTLVQLLFFGGQVHCFCCLFYYSPQRYQSIRVDLARAVTRLIRMIQIFLAQDQPLYPQEKFPRKCNKSFIDHVVCSVKMTGCRFFIGSLCTSLCSANKHAKKGTWPIPSHFDLTLGQ